MNDIFILPISGKYSDTICIVDADKSEELMKHTWWYCPHNGYAYAQPHWRLDFITLHKFLFDKTYNGGKYIDHINRHRLDNRLSNLRLISRSNSGRNKSKKLGTTSKYKGVSFSKRHNKYKAALSIKGDYLWLGYHKTEIAAAKAYNEAAIKRGVDKYYLNNI